jgi:hypothetical protein
MSARIPRSLIDAVLALFRRSDPDFDFQEKPIELAFQNSKVIVFSGSRRDLGPFQVETVHGFIPGIPGTDESVAIARKSACSLYAAATTATWLKALNPFADTL